MDSDEIYQFPCLTKSQEVLWLAVENTPGGDVPSHHLWLNRSAGLGVHLGSIFERDAYPV